MAKEIEEYFIKRLQSYLLEYLQDFSQNNMAKFSLGISTNIVLKNLQLKKQALLNFKLPLYIINGKINQITLNMPLNYKKQQPEMIIEGIDLLVCSIQEANLFEQNKEHHQQGVENLKKHKLKLWEEQMAQNLEKLSPPNWIQKIVDGIYNNMSITIKQFSLRFFNQSLLGYEASLRIKSDIFIKATDKDFKQFFNQDNNSIFKLIEVKRFGISFRGNSNSQFSKKEDQFILNPIDVNVRLTINLIYEQLIQPMKSLDISIKQPLIFQLNKEQKLFIQKLNDFFQYQDVIQDNFHLRPIREIKSNYSEWWKYMINAIMLKQKTTKLDLAYSSKKLVMMKRYIELYKRKQTIILVPWLASWTTQDEVKFKKCEDYLSLKDLLKYREWSFQEIKIEAKRYYNSSKDGQNSQSVKPLLEIWTKTINNKNSFRDHTKRNDNIPIELEDDEKINLYEILERDKTNVLQSYLKGEYNHSDQVKLQFSLEIHSIVFLLLESRALRYIKYTPENTRIFQFCQCRYHLKLLKRASAQRKKSRNSQHHNSFTQACQEIQKSQNIEKSFHTAKELDSFDDDIRDLQEDGSIISLTSNSVERQNDSEIKQNNEQALNQRVILIITIIGINIPLLIYQNDGIRTPNQKITKEGSKNISIGDIRLIAPGMIQKLIEESDSCIQSQSPLFEKKKEQKKSKNLSNQRFRKTVIKFNEFFNEIIEISLTKDSQQFLNSELCYQSLGEFLKQNQMMNIKCFLDDYERDKNGFQDFSLEQYKVYDKYFDDRPTEEDPLFLHFAKHQNNEKKWEFLKNAALNTSDRDKQNQWVSFDNNSKHLFLQQTHNRIVEIIRKCLFVPFVEEYGEILLPICIQNLKDKLTFPTVRPSSIKESEFNHLEICLNYHGQTSEYKIIPNNDVKKYQKLSLDLNKQEQDFLQIHLNKQTLLLSTKSVSSLLCYFEEKKGLSGRQTYHNIVEDQQLLKCITKSKSLDKQIISQQKQNLSIKLEDKFKIKIVTDSLYNKIRTELKLQINKFLIQTLNLEELQKDKDIINYFRGLDDSAIRRQQRFYQVHKAIIYSFKIQHKYFSVDYRQLKDEQRINTEKSNPSARNIQLKDLPNSPGKNKQNHFIKHSSSLWAQFDQKPNSQVSSSNNIKSTGKFKGIKQNIMDTQFICYKLDSTVKNHPLLTDMKLFLYIPHFYLKINDSFTCFIEILTIMNKRLNKKEEENEQRYVMSKDSLMRAELTVLQNEHSNKLKDCKHCILKYRKSLVLTNIIFGEIPQQKTEINIFSLLTYEQKLIFNKQQEKMIEQAKSSGHSQQTFKQKKFTGIRIKFISTPKSIHNEKNISIIAMPFLIITRDLGYFKDTLAVHCTESINKNDQSRANSIKEKEIFKKKTLFDRNRSLRDVQRQPQNIPNFEESKEEQSEKNYLIFNPILKVQNPAKIWEKLDDKFFFYCRSEELNMFNANHEQKQMQQEAKVKSANEMDSIDETALMFNDKNYLFLLCYHHKPLRVAMLSNINEEYYLEKGSKQRFFLSIELLQAIFPNQLASYNIINIIKNISTIKNIVENGYNLSNQDLQEKEEEKQVLKQNPMKLLDEIIVYAMIKKIHIQSNETKFKLNQLKVFIQLGLMASQAPVIVQKRIVQSYLGQKISGPHLQKNRSSIINYSEECQIIRCDTITFSFNKFSQIDIKIINATKHKDELRLSIDDIQISIQSNMPRQRESLLQMPGKDNSAQRAKVALHVNLLFQNYHPLVKVQVEQAKIFVSQQKIQDLLIAMNSFYLISIEESVSLKQHLQNYIFKSNLSLINSEWQIVNLFLKQQKRKKKQLHFVFEVEIDSLIIKLQEKDEDFFLFQFHQIYLKKRLNTELELSIQRIELKPQQQSDTLLQYPNLIEQIEDQTVVFKMENQMIYLENLKFYFISRYINELEAFKQRITEMLQKNQEELAEKYQKDFDMQLQIKQEEDFQKDKDTFLYTIHIKNSLFVIPESSTKSNLVMVDFQFAQVSLQKAKIDLKVPDIDIDEDLLPTILDDKLLIDYKDKNQLESCQFYVIQLVGEFSDVQVNYLITGRHDKKQDVKSIGQFLRAESMTLNFDLPSFEQSCGLIPWKLKDQCKIKTHHLQMNLDLGKLIKVQGFLESNISEKSPLFNFQKSFLQKINYEMFFDDGSLSFTSFTQAEPEKVSQLKEQAKVYQKKKPRNSKNFSQKPQSKITSPV